MTAREFFEIVAAGPNSLENIAGYADRITGEEDWEIFEATERFKRACAEYRKFLNEGVECWRAGGWT